MNPNAHRDAPETPENVEETGTDEQPTQPEAPAERPAVLATTTIHTASDIAIALTLADGTAASVGVMPPALADAIAVAIFGHLSENSEQPQPADETEPASEADIVPKVASVDVPLAIDLDDFARWYAVRDQGLYPSDEVRDVETPDPKEHPQLVAEYVQNLLNR